MSATYKRMEKVLMQHLDDLQRACAGPAAVTEGAQARPPAPRATTASTPGDKENSANVSSTTPEPPTEDDLRLQSSPFGVKSLLMASGGLRAQNVSQKLHCV